MSDHSATIDSLKTKDEILKIRELSRPTVFPWLLDMLVDWSIIGVTLYLAAVAHSLPVYLLAVLVVGNRQHALAILGHDGAHYTLHKNRKLNDFLSNLFCFWPLLITTDGYRTLHFIHHNNTGTSKDPELLHKKARAPQWDLPLSKKKLMWYALKDIVGYSIPDLLIILTFSKPKNKKLLAPVVIWHSVFVTASLASGLWWLALVWYVALATTFMMFFRLRLWIEHQGTFATQRVSLSPVQAAIFAPHKIWLHWEHHRFPTVPYHRLEAARTLHKDSPPLSLSQLIDNLCRSDVLPSGASLDL